MKNLQAYAELCKTEVKNAGIPVGNIVEFKVNKRAKSRWGQCKRRGPCYFIEINSDLLADDIPDSSLNDTLIHEILHTAPDCMNHGCLWNHYANIMNSRGYHISRTSTAQEKGIENYHRERIVNHRFVCNKCGQVINRTRNSKFVQNYELYSCGACGGKFNKLF